jgi:hypothetical protein
MNSNGVSCCECTARLLSLCFKAVKLSTVAQQVFGEREQLQMRPLPVDRRRPPATKLQVLNWNVNSSGRLHSSKVTALRQTTYPKAC